MERKRNRNSNSNSLRILLRILFFLALSVMLASGLKIYLILKDYQRGRETYREIEETANAAADPEVLPAISDEDAPRFRPDIETLKAMNPDCVGFLYCEGVCSYPVVKGTDNEYYLTHLFDGTENSCGAIFMDRDCKGPNDPNCILYGHNMDDGSMFGKLCSYADESFFQMHPDFSLYTETGNYRYRVFSAFRTPVNGTAYRTGFSSVDDFCTFKEEMKSRCPYGTKTAAAQGAAPLLTLSTCTEDSSDEERYVVVLQREEVIE